MYITPEENINYIWFTHKDYNYLFIIVEFYHCIILLENCLLSCHLELMNMSNPLKIASIALCLTLFISNSAKSQNSSMDSLKSQLEVVKGDVKIDLLNQLMKLNVCRDNQAAHDYYLQIKNLANLSSYKKGEVESIKNYGTLKYCTGDLDSALFFYEIAGTLADQHNLKKEAGAIYNNLAAMFGLKGDFVQGIENFKRCKDIGVELEDTVLLMASLNGMGEIYRKKGQTDSALYNFLKVEEIANISNNKPMLLASKINIATIYFVSNRLEKLIENDLKQSIQLATELDDNVSKASLLQLLGSFMFKKGDFDKSLKYLNEGLEVVENTGNVTVKAYLLQGIANVYYKTHQFIEAIEYNQKALDIALSAGLNAMLPLLYGNISSNNLELKQYQKAIDYALMAESYASKTEQVEHKEDIYGYLARAYEGLGMYKEAYQAQKDFNKWDSEYRDKAQTEAVAQLEVNYETEKRELEIVSLSQQASIKDLEIKQKNQGILIGLIVLFFIAGTIYFVYRQRTFKNQQSRTELEQRFLRSQLNPHFISNALMAVQNFMLKNEAEKASTYLAKFSKLMREILENSRQEFISVEDEIQMLTNYLDIHRLRMNESFDYNVEIDENIDVETDTIPPMFVQPFIENAIEHGIINAKGQGLIVLKLVKQGEYIAIEISDNGGGLILGEQKIDHNSLSTTIIQERMALFNKSLKNKIQLIWDNIKDEHGEIQGTKVELKVPFSYL